LGKDIDVVCFLLSVEVERLYEEVCSWRTKASFYETQSLDRNRYDQMMA